MFVLPAVVALAALLTRCGSRRLAGPGVMTGVGLPLLFVGYLNRDGPGDVCTSTAISQTCSQQTSPWPWVGTGLALVLAGAALLVATARHGQQPRRQR